MIREIKILSFSKYICEILLDLWNMVAVVKDNYILIMNISVIFRDFVDRELFSYLTSEFFLAKLMFDVCARFWRDAYSKYQYLSWFIYCSYRLPIYNGVCGSRPCMPVEWPILYLCPQAGRKVESLSSFNQPHIRTLSFYCSGSMWRQSVQQ